MGKPFCADGKMDFLSYIKAIVQDFGVSNPGLLKVNLPCPLGCVGLIRPYGVRTLT